MIDDLLRDFVSVHYVYISWIPSIKQNQLACVTVHRQSQQYIYNHNNRPTTTSPLITISPDPIPLEGEQRYKILCQNRDRFSHI